MLDQCVVFGVGADLNACAESGVLYRRNNRLVGRNRPPANLPSLDEIIRAQPPQRFERDPNVTQLDAYTRYFNWFINKRQPNGVDAFFTRYPIVHHWCERKTHHFYSNITEACNRVLADWDDVSQVFVNGTQELTALKKITSTGSDFHKGGKQVLLLDFEVGGNPSNVVRIVYKPSDVEVDYRLFGKNTPVLNQVLQGPRSFGEAFPGVGGESVAERVNQVCNPVEADRLPTYFILPRNPGSGLELEEERLPIERSYGYIEFLTHNPEPETPYSGDDTALLREVEEVCGSAQHPDWITADPAIAGSFYRQQGQLLAISYLYAVFDLHVQNQIVHALKLHPIDLEESFKMRSDSLRGRGILESLDRMDTPEDSRTQLNLSDGERRSPVYGPVREGGVAHSKSQLYVCPPGMPAYRASSTDPDNLRRAFEGFRDVLVAVLADEGHNASFKKHLQSFNDVVVRFVPRATMNYINRLFGYSLEAVHTLRYEQDEEQFFTRMHQMASWSRTEWQREYVASEREEQEEDRERVRREKRNNPYFVLDSRENNWHDVSIRDIPSYYRRITEAHLYNSRGHPVHVRQTATWQNQNIDNIAVEGIMDSARPEGTDQNVDTYFFEAPFNIVLENLEQETNREALSGRVRRLLDDYTQDASKVNILTNLFVPTP